MENKHVERIIKDCIPKLLVDDVTKYINQLEKEKAEALMVANCISVNHKHLISLRKENAELKQQLAAKDKALDKACEQLTMYNTYDFDDMRTMKDWKEWAEHETN